MNITLPRAEQLWGNKALDVIKKYGTKAAQTELCLLLGGYTGFNLEQINDGPTTNYWTSSCSNKGIWTVFHHGFKSAELSHNRMPTIRPILTPSFTAHIHPDNVIMQPLPNGETIETVTYGMHPQTTASALISQELERDFKIGQLQTSGASYTFDSWSTSYEDKYKSFKPQSYPVYQKNDTYYVRVIGEIDRCFLLFNGKEVRKGKNYWVRVEPIEWLKDPTGAFIAKKSLSSGIRFTEIQHYLNTYFIKEMMQCMDKTQTQEQKKEQTLVQPPKRVSLSQNAASFLRKVSREHQLSR